MVTDFATIVEIMSERCEKVRPEDWKRLKAYDPREHEPVLGAYISACNQLMGSESTLGRPSAQDPSWRNTLTEAHSALEKALPPN